MKPLRLRLCDGKTKKNLNGLDSITFNPNRLDGMVEMSFPFEENVLVERGQFGIMDNFPVTEISEMTEITETTDQMDRLSHPDWIPLSSLYHRFCCAIGVKFGY